MGPDGDSVWFGHAEAQRAARVGVIAEIGVNHDGDVGRAEALVRAAAGAGADAVKLQCFRPGRLLSADARLAGYQAGQAVDAAGLLERLTLGPAELADLAEVTRGLGLRFVLTPFSLEDLDDLASIGVDAVKVASPDAVNTPLLEASAGLGRPMLISTGTADLDELGPAAAAVAARGGALLQCVSAYPTPEPDAALGGIAAIRQRFGLATGYSDHTPAEDGGALAVAAGACVVEKHLTYDRSAAGPDHAASLEPAAFERYVAAVRRATAMLGPVAKRCGAVERDVRAVSRQSVCVTRDLPAGHVLRAGDLTVKRPGTGLPAARLASVLGRRLARAVQGDRLLRAEDLTDASGS
jgi:N-acetylneuraminate synthase/N,N'-diacetyllegionaminate synthase